MFPNCTFVIEVCFVVPVCFTFGLFRWTFLGHVVSVCIPDQCTEKKGKLANKRKLALHISLFSVYMPCVLFSAPDVESTRLFAQIGIPCMCTVETRAFW